MRERLYTFIWTTPDGEARKDAPQAYPTDNMAVAAAMTTLRRSSARESVSIIRDDNITVDTIHHERVMRRRLRA